MARVYTDRDLIELFRMLLRQQIRDERINSIDYGSGYDACRKSDIEIILRELSTRP